MASFDQKPEPRGLFHLEQVACPSSEPVTNIWAKELSFLKQKLGKVVFPPEELNSLREKALPQLQHFSLQKTALGVPEGAFAALTSHTLFFQMNLNLFLSKSPQKKEKK